jgi:hypothetical protein
MERYDLSDGTTVIEGGASVEAEKSSVRIIDAGEVAGAVVVNFANGGVFKCAPTNTTALNVSSLAVGQRAFVQIQMPTRAVALTWVGVDKWLGDVTPTFIDAGLTVVELINDGDQILGLFDAEKLVVEPATFVADLDETVDKTDIDDAGTIDGTEIAAAMSAQNAAINALKDVLVANGLMEAGA